MSFFPAARPGSFSTTLDYILMKVTLIGDLLIAILSLGILWAIDKYTGAGVFKRRVPYRMHIPVCDFPVPSV